MMIVLKLPAKRLARPCFDRNKLQINEYTSFDASIQPPVKDQYRYNARKYDLPEYYLDSLKVENSVHARFLLCVLLYSTPVILLVYNSI